MKILAFDHNANIGQYRNRYFELATLPGVEMRLVIPKYLAAYSKVRLNDAICGDEAVPIVALTNLQDGSVHRGFFWDIMGIVRQLRLSAPDIVFVHGELETWYSIQLLLLSKLLVPNARVVMLTFMNINLYRIGFPYRFGFLYSLIYRFCNRHVDGMFSCTREGVEQLELNGFAGPIRHIGVGVDMTHFRKRESGHLKTELGLTKVVLGFAGRLEAEKGLDTLVRAVALTGRSIQLLFVGTGSAREEIAELAEQCRVDLRIIDAVGYDRMPEFLNCMDALILPSLTTKYWKEQFGRVIIEAMACGVPVIGSSSGEIPEVVGDSGLIFTEGSVEDLASKILQLCDDPGLREALSVRGVKRVSEKYTWNRIASDMYGFFCDLVKAEPQVKCLVREASL